MKNNLFWRLLPVHLIIAAVCILPVWQHHIAVAKAEHAGIIAETTLKTAPTDIKPDLIEGTPNRLIIPRLAVDIAVVEGEYNNFQKSWSVAKDTANYMPSTGKINDKQDMPLIYGHWTRQILGPTKDLVSGDIAYVYSDNNHLFKYQFTGDFVTKPTDVQVFEQLKGKPGIALMTCEGSWAQNRRLMYFNLVEAK